MSNPEIPEQLPPAADSPHDNPRMIFLVDEAPSAMIGRYAGGWPMRHRSNPQVETPHTTPAISPETWARIGQTLADLDETMQSMQLGAAAQENVTGKRYIPAVVVLPEYTDDALHAGKWFRGDAARDLLRVPAEYRQAVMREVTDRAFEFGTTGGMPVIKKSVPPGPARRAVIQEVLAQLATDQNPA